MKSLPRLLTLLFAQAVALFAQPTIPAADATVLTVNGEPVSADEYMLVMRRKTASVYNHFKQTRDLDDHRGYWSPASGPDGPLAKLRELTLAELIRIKVFQSEARTRGLMKNIDFASFRTAHEKENARRLKAKARNEVIYGPPQYRPDVYYFILFGDIAYKVEQAMAQELESSVTPSEVDAFLKQHHEDFSTLSPEEAQKRAVIVLSTRAATKKLQELRDSATTKTQEDLLAPIVPRKDLDAAGQAIP